MPGIGWCGRPMLRGTTMRARWIAAWMAVTLVAGCERAERIPPPPVEDAGPPPQRPRFHVNAWLPKLEQQLIRWRIKADIARIVFCYELMLLDTPGLEGTVHTTFMIEDGGWVSSVEAKGLGPRVDDCVAGVLRSLQFPLKGRVKVNYPFTFRPTGG
jgi:hypothetical protein